MNDNFYKHLIDKLPIGYAFIKVINNDSGCPYDYEFIEVNEIFEEIARMESSRIVGKRISKLFPNLEISVFNQICNDLKNENIEKKQFEQFLKELKKWYKIIVYSPKKDFLIIHLIDITMEKDQLIELENSRRRMENILEGTNVGTWELNMDTGEVNRNERWADILGYTLEELYPITRDTWKNMVHPDDLVVELDRDNKLYNREIEYYDDEYRMRHKDGSWVWIQDRGKVISWSDDGKPLIISGTHTDITERKKLEIELANEKNLLKTTLISVGDGVISTDNKGKIVFINKVAELLTGWTQEEAKNKPFKEVFNTVNELTREKCENIVKKVLKRKKILEIANHTILISKKGMEISIEDRAAPIVQENGDIVGVVLVFRDCSDKKKKQEEILYLSYCDQLTGLYNRRFFEEEVNRLNIKENLPITLIMADVNGLKLINDSFGHTLGDELLKRVADILKQGCRNSDIIARLGGDEFVVILTNTDSYQAEQIIKRINALAFEEKIGAVDISISLGYETKYNENDNMLEIFKNAEDNMYRNKLYESASIRNKTIDLIMNTLYEKSNREMLHSKRVSKLSEAIAISMGLDGEKSNQIRIAGLMHDIGKIGVDEKILNKSQMLNSDEWKEMRRHTEIGYRILSSSNDFSEIAEYVLKHHERWDGKGYPGGFKGEEISLQSRIIAIADAFDAMTSDRPYRKGMSLKEAIAELYRCSGTQFDSNITNVFINKVLQK